MRWAALVALLCGSGLAAAEFATAELVVESDPFVRAGVLFRCQVRGTAPPAARFLTVAVLDGGLVLAARELPLTSPAQLAHGITVVLAPSRAASAPEVQVRVSDGSHQALLRQRVSVVGVLPSAPLESSFAGEAGARLVAEQLAELRQVGTPTRAQLGLAQALIGRLAGDAEVAGVRHLAIPDPVDGSVHPARLHGVQAAGAGQSLVILLRPEPGQTKSAWGAMPPSWLAAAAAAGVAVLEVYPAGDLALTGVARRRAAQAEVAARQVAPQLMASWPMIAHPGLADAAAWRRATPLPPTPPTRGRLAAWAAGPFVVVVGTGEHAAAQQDQQMLSEAFIRAWAAHAHGLPPRVLDTEFSAERWVGYHLVLIGSSRSNAVVRQRCPTLPVTWDDRSVRVGDRVCQRAYRPALALALADPQAAGQTILVLDGDPAWGAPAGELPLQAEAATADLVLRPGRQDEGPVVRLLLEPQASPP